MAKKNVKKDNLKVEVQEGAAETMVVQDEAPVSEVESKEEIVNAPLNTVETEGITDNNMKAPVVVTEDIVKDNSNAEADLATGNMDAVIENENVNMEETVAGNETVECLNDSMENKKVTQVVPHIEFRSDSEMAKHYIMELVADKESHKKQELVAYITEKAGKNFSDAIVINVLRNMTTSGGLMQLQRGSYQMGSGIGLVSKLVSFIDATRKGLEKISTVSVSDITEADLSAISEIKQLMDTLECMYERLVRN